MYEKAHSRGSTNYRDLRSRDKLERDIDWTEVLKVYKVLGFRAVVNLLKL